MRRWIWTALITCAATVLTGGLRAQTGAMPGTVVSNTSNDTLKVVGSEQPRVAKQVGQGVSQPYGNLKPYDPNNPYAVFQGTNLSVKNVVAPVNNIPTNVEPSLFTQVVSGLKSLAGLDVKPKVTPIFTPGIFRRDRERVKARMFVHD
jgi:hypothetical protein